MVSRVLLVALIIGGPAVLAEAQAPQPGRLYRIGFLGFTSPGIESRALDALKSRLEELGYVDGRNVSIVYRWADWERFRYPELALELAHLGVDVVTAPCGWGLGAVRRASPTMPVAARCIGLRELGTEIRDGPRPTAFTTAVTSFVPDAIARRLEVVRKLFPRAERIVLLYRPESDWEGKLDDVEAAARSLRFRSVRIAWRGAWELPLVLAKVTRNDVLLPLTDGLTLFHADRLVHLVNERRLAAVYDDRAYVASGGLASYGPDLQDVYRKVAGQLVRMLEGERPEQIPVERAERLELVVNKATASRLGVAIPPSLMERVDQTLDSAPITGLR